MKVAICGAGIAGLALAGQLAGLGHQVVVVEQAAGPRRQGYMIGFFGPGFDAVEAMGVLPRVRELGREVEEAVYVDGSGRRRASIRLSRFNASMNGRALSIMRPDLEMALRENLPGSVDLRYGVGPAQIANDAGGVAMTLTDGSTVEADLLVGADGVHSKVRSIAFGPEPGFLRYLGFHTAAFSFVDDQIYNQVRNRFCLSDTIGRQVGLYGVADGKVAAFTVHRTSDPRTPADPRAAIQETYGELGWIVPKVLEHCPPASQIYYDQVAQVEMLRWSDRRVSLVGDACFAVSLLAGQGSSMALGGSYILAEQLDRADSIADGLAAYEAMWRPLVTEKQRVARNGSRWFLPESALQLRVRRTALKLARIPIVDRYVSGTFSGKPIDGIRNLASESAPDGFGGNPVC